MISKQEIFDRVTKHLLTQGEQCLTEGGQCSYRALDSNDNVTMCAVGCLIDDAFYSPKMEGESAASDTIMNAVFESFRTEDPESPKFEFNDFTLQIRTLLKDLQDIHDDWSPDQWETRLQIIAQRWELEYRPPETAKHSAEN